MSLALPYTRAVLTNRSLWFWGIVFMAFWFVLGAYVFTAGSTFTARGEMEYTSAWFAVIALFSLTTLAMGIASSIEYGTSALAYSFRYSRLTPPAYVLSLLVAAAAMGVVLGLMMTGMVSGLFSAHFGRVILPANVPAILGVSVLSGMFMMGLATTLVVLVVNILGLRSMSFVGFVPLILAYLFGFAQLFLALPTWLIYLSPWNDIQSLLYQGYSGLATPVVLTNGGPATLYWPFSVAGLLAWVGVLVGLSSRMLRRIRAVSLEEGRQI